MHWHDIRNAYSNQWLAIEAIEAVTTLDHRNVLKRIAVMERCVTGSDAFQSYRRLHQIHSAREFCFVHTSREELESYERHGIGVRRGAAGPVA